MTIDNTREEYWRHEMQRRRSGGGDGGDAGDPPPGLEPRVARIEADTEHIKADIGRIVSEVADLKKVATATQLDVAKGIGEVRTIFASLDERSKHFTTKWDVVAMLALLMGLVAAVIAVTVRFMPAVG